MKTINMLFITLLLATSANVSANTPENIIPATSTSNPPANLHPQPEVILEQLRLHIVELKGILSQQPQDMTLIKTKTSWIRKQLADLHTWSFKQAANTENKDTLERLRIIIGNMLQEVERDDMLDATDLQTLSINRTQAEHLLTKIQNNQQQTDSPAP